MHGKGKGGLITSLVFLIITTLFTMVTISIPLSVILSNLNEYKSDLIQLLPFPICALITFILIIVCFVFLGRYKRVNEASPLFMVYLTIFFSHLPYSYLWIFITNFEDDWGFIPWHNLLIVLISFIMFILLLAAKALKSRIMRLLTYLLSIFVFIYFLGTNFSLIYTLFVNSEASRILGHPLMYVPYVILLEMVFFILFITSIVLTVSCSKKTYEKYNKFGFDESTGKIFLAILAVIGFQRGYYSREIMNSELDTLTEEEKAKVQEAIHNEEALKYVDQIFADYRFTRDFHMMKDYILSHR